MNRCVDMDQYDVVVTFKNGHQLNGICTGNPIACTPAEHHGIFDRPFLFLDTCVLIAETREYDTGYRAMIRTEDIAMLQAKKIPKEVTE